ncbi:uncharacterized protein BDW70DRAFT_136222 [Aspergillus foveolatus]|uniref:uncharacterized protein n=1 Tax=Aspergillus foveolatus TaxID=210207 RepID=UPI003CCC9074
MQISYYYYHLLPWQGLSLLYGVAYAVCKDRPRWTVHSSTTIFKIALAYRILNPCTKAALSWCPFLCIPDTQARSSRPIAFVGFFCLP